MDLRIRIRCSNALGTLGLFIFSLSSGGENVSVGYFKLDEKTREEFYTDEKGTRWFREGLVQQSINHNVIFRVSHDYNPSAITLFSVLAMKCFFTVIYGSNTIVQLSLTGTTCTVPILHYNVTIHSSQSILMATIIFTFNATLRFSFVLINQLTPNFYTDGNGTRWFREGLVLQSVSHNGKVIFRCGHECFSKFLSGPNRLVNSGDIYQFDSTMLSYIPLWSQSIN
jgi:hypothetical protein